MGFLNTTTTIFYEGHEWGCQFRLVVYSEVWLSANVIKNYVNAWINLCICSTCLYWRMYWHVENVFKISYKGNGATLPEVSLVFLLLNLSHGFGLVWSAEQRFNSLTSRRSQIDWLKYCSVEVETALQI